MSKIFVGVDIGGTSIKLGILDENGSIFARKEIPYRDLLGKVANDLTVMDVLISGIRDIYMDWAEDNRIKAAQYADNQIKDTQPEVNRSEENQSEENRSEDRISESASSENCNSSMRTTEYKKMDGLSGIGVSAAGCINSVTGMVAQNGGNIPGWPRTHVCEILESEFGVPCTVANDANCAVLGEQWKGAAAGCSDVVGVTLGTGVGGGIITGGKLLEGSRGYAGEIGHFPTHGGGEKCVCGLSGCYERYASTSALVRNASEENADWDNGRAFFRAVEAGDEQAVRILEDWICEIAYGITGLVHLFDPKMILIGGGVSVQQKLLIEPLKDKVLSAVMPDYASGLEFRSAKLGNDAGITGAVKYLIDHIPETH